jgi:Tfp pilus assembly protein PilF
LEQAEDYTRKAIALFPGVSDFNITLANLYMNTNRGKQARTTLEQLLKRDSNNTNALIVFAKILLREKDRANAKLYYRKAVGLGAQDAQLKRIFGF